MGAVYVLGERGNVVAREHKSGRYLIDELRFVMNQEDESGQQGGLAVMRSK